MDLLELHLPNAAPAPALGHARAKLNLRFVPEADMARRSTRYTTTASAQIGCAPSVELVSYANGISALVLEMLILSYRHQRASGHHQGITYSAGHIVVRPNA